MVKRKPRPLLLRQASAYYRNAAKADRAGQRRQAEHWRKVADGLVERHRRQSTIRSAFKGV